MHYDQNPGTLDVGQQVRSGGKVVDEWKFRSPFKGKDAPKLSATISVDKSDRNRFTFVAHSDSLTAPIVDTDINRLREKVDAALREQHDLLTGITWEDWLEVVVRGQRTDQPQLATIESQLVISYHRLKRGVCPKTGEAYVVNSNGIAMPFPAPKKAGERDPGDDDSQSLIGARLGARQRDYEYSYVPATPENIAGLENLISAMLQVRDRLAAFLRQDVVAQSLADHAIRAPALPAPL